MLTFSNVFFVAEWGLETTWKDEWLTEMLQACLTTQRYLDVKGKDKFTQLEECELSGV